MGNCFTSEPQECVQCIVKVRDQETQTQLRRPDRRTLGMPRNEANEKRAERELQGPNKLGLSCAKLRVSLDPKDFPKIFGVQ